MNITYRYAIALDLDPSKGAPAVWRTVHSWLTRGRREQIEYDSLVRAGDHRLPGGSRVEVSYTDSGSPYLHACRYSHADSSIDGRRWITEIGLRGDAGSGSIRASIALGTEDISSRSLPEVRLTRPLLVRDFLEYNKPLDTTIGLSVQQLNASNALSVKGSITDPSRGLPLVIISSDATGSYAVDSRRLQSLLCGLAGVIEIVPGTDTRRLASQLGEAYTPWMGGVRLVYPISDGPYADGAPVRRISPEELDDWRIAGLDASQEIFGLVSRRALRAGLSRHVTVEQVHSEKARRTVARNRRDAGAAAETLRLDIELLEQIIGEREQEIHSLKSLLEERDVQLELAADDLRALEKTKDAVTLQLSVARDTGGDPVLNSASRESLLRAISDYGLTLPDALDAAALLCGDRLIVLDSARRSAAESVAFNKPRKALELLLSLGGGYWEALAGGAPDGVAKKVFGSSYAATDNESPASRKRRRFLYRGEHLEMLSHLKIGRRDSITETLRIHFHWDSANKVIAVGHCGRHLDHD
jgi:hypothetical protein